ncbi:MAG TPA: hypothetical protein DDY68_05115 [Porphyromonadaceae bacterium]|nr:hypothetical protein [Porphyromonadaceae bacterium]
MEIEHILCGNTAHCIEKYNVFSVYGHHILFCRGFVLLLFTLFSMLSLNAEKWDGDTTLYSFGADGWATLIDTKKGSSYVSKSFTQFKGTKWTLSVKISKEPTNSNHIKFYVSANKSNLLDNTLCGYYVSIGMKDKSISLYKQNGPNSTLLIQGKKNRMRTSNNDFTIILSKDSTHLWKLHTKDDFLGDSIFEGEVKDTPAKTYSIMGVNCVYSKESNNSYKWGNLSIAEYQKGGGSKEKPPVLQKITCTSDSTIEILYDKQLDISKATFFLYPNCEYCIGKTLGEEGKSVIVAFPLYFEENIQYAVDILGIRDIYGNITPWSVENFTYTLGKKVYTPKFGDIVFSEVMTNPKGVVDIPEVQYVELYNRTDSFLQLGECSFLHNQTEKTLSEYTFPPKSFLVLCNIGASKKFPDSIPVLPISYFHINENALLQLRNKGNEILCWVDYKRDWYPSEESAEGGHSLEIMDTQNLIGDSTNWKVCISSKGGTPGEVNSVKQTNPDNTPPKITKDSLMGGNKVRIEFNKPMSIESLSHAGNYTLSSSFSLDSLHYENPQGRWVELYLSKSLNEGDSISIHLTSMQDISKKFLLDTLFSIAIHKPVERIYTPKFGDIVFSEVMTNPEGAIGVPEVQYVELYNHTDSILQLEGCSFSKGTSKRNLSTYAFPPKSYLILCNVTSSKKFDKNVSVLPVPYFPELDRTNGVLYLINRRGEYIMWVEYKEEWYLHTRAVESGSSLEVIDVNNLIGDSTNWGKCVSIKGGTPGEVNSIRSTNADVSTPLIKSYSLLEKKGIKIEFSKSMNLTDISNPKNYTSSNPLLTIDSLSYQNPQGKWVQLYFAKPFEEGEEILLHVKSMRDISGNLFTETSILLTFHKSQEVEKGEVLFNEIMFNPSIENGAFIEFYNKSEKNIDLSTLFICKRNAKDSLINKTPLSNSTQWLYAHTYIAVGKDKETIVKNYPYSIPEYVLQQEDIFHLNKQEGTLVLINSKKEVIDEFSYKQTMHSVPSSGRQGVSLERKSLEVGTQNVENWTSASSSVQYATPGRENSASSPSHLEQGEGFVIENDVLHLYGDENLSTLRIYYSFFHSGFIANVYLYNLRGKRVATICTNFTLGSIGVIEWRPNGNDRFSFSLGGYVLVIEYYDSMNSAKKLKFPLVITQ